MGDRSARLCRWAAWGIVGYGLALRLAFPGADPIHPTWSGWLSDEGRWTELAREWALFRAPDLDTAWSSLHLVLAPAFQVFSGGVFELLGVTFASARLVSQVAGVAVLLMVATKLSRPFHPLAWLGVLLLASVHPEMVYFSRVAIPEMPALLFQTMAFFLLVTGSRTSRRSFLAGVLTAVGVATKATMAPVAIAFLAVIWVTRDAAVTSPPLRHAGAYFLGLMAPGFALLLAAVAIGGPSAALVGDTGGIQAILTFARLDSVYGMATTLYRDPAATHVNLLLAVLWPVSLGVWLRGAPMSQELRLFTGSLVWAMGWLVPWALLAYFPDRYLVHVYLPLVIAIGAGLTVLGEPERPSLQDGFNALSFPGRVLLAVLAALPMAAVVAPGLLSVLDLAGLRLEQFRFHALVVVGTAVVIGARFVARGRMPLGVSTVFFPMAVAVLLGFGNGPGVMDNWLGEYWRVDGGRLLGRWMLTLLGGVTLTFAAAAAGRGMDAHRRILGWSVAYAVGLAMVWTVTNHIPSMVQRTYAVAAVAADLRERYGPDRVIGVTQATSILIDTPFRYREFSGDEAATDIVLAASHAGGRIPALETVLVSYRLVRAYEVPSLAYARGSRSPSVAVRLYERVVPTGRTDGNSGGGSAGVGPGRAPVAALTHSGFRSRVSAGRR